MEKKGVEEKAEPSRAEKCIGANKCEETRIRKKNEKKGSTILRSEVERSSLDRFCVADAAVAPGVSTIRVFHVHIYIYTYKHLIYIG